MRRLFALLCLTLFLQACAKKNPNYEPPPPYDDKPVGHHRFDGGETDPYLRKAGSAEDAPAKSD